MSFDDDKLSVIQKTMGNVTAGQKSTEHPDAVSVAPQPPRRHRTISNILVPPTYTALESTPPRSQRSQSLPIGIAPATPASSHRVSSPGVCFSGRCMFFLNISFNF